MESASEGHSSSVPWCLAHHTRKAGLRVFVFVSATNRASSYLRYSYNASKHMGKSYHYLDPISERYGGMMMRDICGMKVRWKGKGADVEGVGLTLRGHEKPYSLSAMGNQVLVRNGKVSTAIGAGGGGMD